MRVRWGWAPTSPGRSPRRSGSTWQELVGTVRNHWFAVVGLSVSCDSRLDVLASCIHAIRRASRNRAIGVLVGGAVFVEHPELARRIGADATALDGRQAVLQAQNILALLPRAAR